MQSGVCVLDVACAIIGGEKDPLVNCALDVSPVGAILLCGCLVNFSQQVFYDFHVAGQMNKEMCLHLLSS